MIMSKYRDLDEQSSSGTKACQSQHHMISGAAPYQPLSKAYSELQKKYKSLDQKYNALKKSWLDSQSLMQNGDVRRDINLASVSGPPSGRSCVGIPEFGSAPQMHAPLTRVASLERYVLRQEADIREKNDEIIRLRTAMEHNAREVNRQKQQFEKKSQVQLAEIANLHAELDKRRSENVVFRSTSGKRNIEVVSSSSPKSSTISQLGSEPDELESLKMELSKYKVGQQALMKLVQEQGSIIKSLLNQAKQRSMDKGDHVLEDRNLKSEAKRIHESQALVLISPSGILPDDIVLQNAKDKSPSIARQKSNITVQCTDSDSILSRGANPGTDFQDTDVMKENYLIKRDNIPQGDGKNFASGIGESGIGGSESTKQTYPQRRDPLKSNGENFQSQTSLFVSSPEDETSSSGLSKRYSRRNFLSVSSEEKTCEYDTEIYTHQRSKSTSALPASRPKELSPPMQNCPVCNEDFPLIGVSDFQQHVLECMETHNAMSGIRPVTPGAESRNHSSHSVSGLPIIAVENGLKSSQATSHFPKPLNTDLNEFTDYACRSYQEQPDKEFDLNLSTQLENVDIGSTGDKSGINLPKNASSPLRTYQDNIYVEMVSNAVAEPAKEKRICPVCSVGFPHFSSGDIQAHVLECSDTINEHQNRVCPMCLKHFPNIAEERTFVNHVQSHFDHENVLGFEVVHDT